MGIGSFDVVMTGKNYDRAMHCHKVLIEALEQLLLKKFLLMREKDELLTSLSADTWALVESLFSSPGVLALEEAVNDVDLVQLLEEYMTFRDEVLAGSLGQTAQFWMSYM